MNIQLLESDEELDKVARVLLQLRPKYDLDSLKTQIKLQRESGYNLAYVTCGHSVLSVAGFVVGQKLAWGKHVYVDDLVTDERHRSSGAGALLVDWIKQYAKEIGCSQVHLDSGVQRFQAHRFYLREKFNIESHHFSITGL
ncbi:GNAT family N-acetyltransferase [Microbulbifer salipaludis]|uniref:GNAT family N-acetyltransferase n=1 Tax=Microbulbifer salipaludis TaxID=187980 RepID=A0ABS3E251_9GAMM|nr:GNAT family N-acetyltransferase [Microbulbifer salipaludis]MBN8429360.1 GNAT family N-acetyltransferase [Microbulbifer salipaludis]